MMKRLGRETRALIVRCVVEGAGVNAVARITGVSKNTVLKLVADLGPVCRAYQARALRGLVCAEIHVDQRPVAGDNGLWVATCARSGLAVSWLLGPRDPLAARLFLRDVATRVARGAQVTGRGRAAPALCKPGRVSRKAANLKHTLDLGFMVHNFVRGRGRKRISPAMRAGVCDHRWSYEEVVALLEAEEPTAAEVGARRRDRRITLNQLENRDAVRARGVGAATRARAHAARARPSARESRPPP